MGKTVAELFANMPCTILGDKDQVVTGAAFNSREVKPGDVFFCIVGTKVDGHSFAQDAIDRGAKVLVVERKLYVTSDMDDVTVVMVSDSRKAMARIASRFFDNPSEQFKLVGITGTNGKTTTTYLVEHIGDFAGMTTGLIGTVGIRIDGVQEKSTHTTPESLELQSLFGRMVDAGCDMVTMEVSSHALDLDRTWATKFEVTAFTNLTQDHLDYHNTFEAYFEAKARLFSKDYPAKRVICIDDEWGKELHRRCSMREDDVITTGFTRSAQIHPTKVTYHKTHTELDLEVRGSSFKLDYPLVGRFNVENVMTALGIGIQLGIPVNTVIAALDDAPQIPGRLQRVAVPNDGGVAVYVDYAHTPDALKKAISAVKELTEGRTIVVFGCGGDRDSSKRPIMGKAALDGDYAIVTSDNPRTEDPMAIIGNIITGMGASGSHYEIEPDRAKAIERAIACAQPGDSVLIAGKGHEDYQLVGSEVLHFDDVEIAAALLEQANA